MAEIIPIEPDPGNAGEGSLSSLSLSLRFNKSTILLRVRFPFKGKLEFVTKGSFRMGKGLIKGCLNVSG